MKIPQKELTISRIIRAPRELVFRAFTEPARLAEWWGPYGFTNPVCDLDLRPGGAIRIDMRGPDGVVYPMTGVYREIVKPSKLVFTSSALDRNGKPLFDVLNTIDFISDGGNTTLVVHAVVSYATPEAEQYLAGMDEGWTQTINRLEEYVQSIKGVV